MIFLSLPSLTSFSPEEVFVDPREAEGDSQREGADQSMRRVQGEPCVQIAGLG